MVIEESLRLGRSITDIQNAEKGINLDFSMNWNSRVIKIGITGGPGAGKSSFINQLTKRFLGLGFSIAVLMIDPTSRRTGGALLADRVRLDPHLLEHNLFVRSLATGNSLDGLPETLVPILHFLENETFDLIFIETIGIGQDSIGIRRVSDILVTLPSNESGDILQYFKMGAFEVADYIFFNKSDLFPGGTNLNAQNLINEFLSVKHWGDDKIPQPFFGNTVNDDGMTELLQVLERTVREHLKHAE